MSKWKKITLFHGTSSRIVVPTYGLGEKKHDYGKGFYLTDNLNLAKEWAVCKPDDENGWVHQYKLDTDRLKILDFQEKRCSLMAGGADETTEMPPIPNVTGCYQKNLLRNME